MDILETILGKLPDSRAELEQVAHGSGVPFNTLLKIKSRAIKSPRISTVQKLTDYYRTSEAAA